MEETKTSENIANEKVTNNKKKNKTRMILVLIFILLFAISSYVSLRGSYLEYLELGEKYIEVFNTNLAYKYGIMLINFVFLYFVIYFTNRGIKKGLKPFFEKEQRPMPKLLNKTLALVISLIVSIIISTALMEKMMLVFNSTSFGIADKIFGMDISYFMFQKPIIEAFIIYFILLFAGLTIYTAAYYIIVFNRYFDGIDSDLLKNSLFIKKLTRNILFIGIGIAILTVVNTQNIVYGKILTIDGNIDLIGAGITESTLQLWGYAIFAIIIVIFTIRAIKSFKKGDTSKTIKNIAVIPLYLVALFIVMVGFDLIFVNSNELDKEREYIEENIASTKNAYNINIEETNIENSGTITDAEVEKNDDIINNIPIINQNVVLKTLQDNQTGTGYFSFRNANLAKYKVGYQEKIVYIATRGIVNSGRTYNNKTYEYTHGMGAIVAFASDATENGNLEYIQKEVSGKDEKIKISEPRIYFDNEASGIVATNTNNKQEYDYTDENGNDITSKYNGTAGLSLGFLDRLILGITKGDLNLAFSGEVTNESKILINRNIIERAKKILPYVIYDEEPYPVITDDGKIVWVLDAYTTSSNYPYSNYTNVKYNGGSLNINYIRNSIKVLIDSYNGDIKFYITDRSDPIAMAYRNIYKDLFADLNEEIPSDITSHFVYPKFLYNVQAEILKTYHNVKPDVLYRADDLWDIAKYSTSRSTNTAGTYLEPYYTMVKTSNGEDLGLVQIYTPDEKQNIIAYLVGSIEGESNKLKLYKFSADSNIVGPMQLDKQIEEDEAISKELEGLNATGTRLTKQMVIVPIENTLLYVESIYQTMLNESDVPVLKKVVVASGNKVAIGNNLETALENLLSTYAVNIEVENTDDIDGLIDAIIRANKNLTDSNKNNDWELMGNDIKRLQELIDSLEKLKTEEDENEKELENQNNTVDTNSLYVNNSTNTSR